MSSSLYGGQGSAPAGAMPTNTATGNYGKSWKEKIPKGYDRTRIQQFTPEQMQLFSQMFGQSLTAKFTFSFVPNSLFLCLDG